MAADSSPIRSPQPAGASATIVALLSMALAMPANAVPSIDTRPVAPESASMREMAVAMVAAAARDLLKSQDRLDVALHGSPVGGVIETPRVDLPRLEVESTLAHFRALDERLLDLPPPSC